MSGSVIGSGSDSIVLNMAEDQALGQDATFTVNVDGQQIGGPQTVTASQSSGQTEPFTFEGNYAPGEHDVTVTFTNNFIYPGLTGDRNVYVDGVTYDGQTVSNSTTPIYESPWYPPNSTVGNVYGNAVFSVNDTTSVPSDAASTPSTSPSPVSVGSGPDTLVLNMAEDPYDGDAQFTVAVDGQQVGGTLSTSAIVSQGQSQEFDISGNFGPGTHTVSVDYTNDAVGGYYPSGTPDLPPTSGQWALDTADRNLYVMGMSLDGGAPASGAPWELSSSGTENFTVTSGSNPSATEFSSGLFASDGAAATSDNAAVTSSAVASGSSSSMSFVASPTTDTTSASSTDSTGTSDTTSTTTDTTPTVTAAASSAAPTTQDFSVPATTGATTSNPNTGSSSGAWSATHHTPTVHAWAHHG